MTGRPTKSWCNVLFLVYLPLLGCPTGPTGYQEADSQWQYGYRDEALGDNEFSIIVTGHETTPPQRLMNIALLRAAHITQEKGLTHFEVKAETTERFRREGLPLYPIPVTGVERNRVTVMIIRLVPEGTPLPPRAISAPATVERLNKGLD